MKIHGLTKRSSYYTILFQMRCWMTSCLNQDYLILIFIHLPYLLYENHRLSEIKYLTYIYPFLVVQWPLNNQKWSFNVVTSDETITMSALFLWEEDVFTNRTPCRFVLIEVAVPTKERKRSCTYVYACYRFRFFLFLIVDLLCFYLFVLIFFCSFRNQTLSIKMQTDLANVYTLKFCWLLNVYFYVYI